ncbi:MULTISPECIES: YdcH family protein [unclassified Pseudomonas]|uniref:YdcH family protein n=1 Tax=unclassified Pseudomonas TaxID=196821 RepID=UPI0029EED13F|nr:YdcH family protein [Pseudomonas putida]HYQ50786.1 YdcH family protein [Pseudomonas sp.]
MPVPHDLLADLHVTADAFQALIDKDHTLHALHKEYNAKDKEVVAAEGNGTNDDAVNRLRKERLLIKDKIERIIHPPKS